MESLRVGSIVEGVVGRVSESRSSFLLVPNQPLRIQSAPRPPRPPMPNADVVVASFNVLNYFTTIDDGNNNARGADSPSEFNRQELKIVAAIDQLDADIVGLMEIENGEDAERTLLAALNRSNPKSSFVGCGVPDKLLSSPGGGDAIRVGIIYKDEIVEPIGPATVINDPAFGRARTPIVQTFRIKPDGQPLTVIVNHFKSKGGASGADVPNKDKGDGQAAYNATRRDQASAIVRYVDSLPVTDDGPPRVLIIGDLNAYSQEDPIDRFRAAGLVDLQGIHDDQPDYSFVYYGQSGSLDHAIATTTLADDVTQIATWHINADEPKWLDYNQEFNPPALFRPDPYRSSDHDPVLIGIRSLAP